MDNGDQEEALSKKERSNLNPLTKHGEIQHESVDLDQDTAVLICMAVPKTVLVGTSMPNKPFLEHTTATRRQALLRLSAASKVNGYERLANTKWRVQLVR